MICVYVLKSIKDDNRYIGSTSDLERRLKQHLNGCVVSTKNRRPLTLYAYQKCSTLKEARNLERVYKRSRGKYNKAIKKGSLLLVR